jgi:HAMP domain-containing protein
VEGSPRCRPGGPPLLLTRRALQAFDAIRADLDAVVGLNSGAIQRADQGARAMAQNYSLILGLLGMSGLAVAVHFHRRVSSSFIEPMRQISIMAQRMSHGDFSLRLPHNRADEFGLLAIEVNRLLERMEMNKERAARERSSSGNRLGAHRAHDPPTILLGLAVVIAAPGASYQGGGHRGARDPLALDAERRSCAGLSYKPRASRSHRLRRRCTLARHAQLLKRDSGSGGAGRAPAYITEGFRPSFPDQIR